MGKAACVDDKKKLWDWEKKYMHGIFSCSCLLLLSICLFYRVLIWRPTTGAAFWLYINLRFRLIFDAEFVACSLCLLLLSVWFETGERQKFPRQFRYRFRAVLPWRQHGGNCLKLLGSANANPKAVWIYDSY